MNAAVLYKRYNIKSFQYSFNRKILDCPNICIIIIIILMKNRKNEQKPLYNEENGLY